MDEQRDGLVEEAVGGGAADDGFPGDGGRGGEGGEGAEGFVEEAEGGIDGEDRGGGREGEFEELSMELLGVGFCSDGRGVVEERFEDSSRARGGGKHRRWKEI